MRDKTVVTRNLRAARRGADQLLALAAEQAAKPELLRAGPLGLFFGASGIGKSHALLHLRDELRGTGVEVFFLRAQQVWASTASASLLLSEWLSAAGCARDIRTVRDGYTLLLGSLSDRRSLTVVDEADYLVQTAGAHPHLNLIRDLADRAAHPVLFAGVNRLRQRLATPSNFTAQISTRIAVEIEFTHLGVGDARLLARELVEKIDLGADLIALLLKASNGSTRRLLGLYGQVEQAAASAGMSGAFGVADAVKCGLMDAPAPSPNDKSQETPMARPADARARVA